MSLRATSAGAPCARIAAKIAKFDIVRFRPVVLLKIEHDVKLKLISNHLLCEARAPIARVDDRMC